MLFDLDGTLLDTAPDLCFALNSALNEQGFERISDAVITPFISQGAVGMVRQALGSSEHPQYESILALMLEIYTDNLANHTTLFEGMDQVLNRIETRNLHWGIVTNKRTRFTQSILKQLDLFDRASCIICGDTTANKKPHPRPMLAACRQLQIKPMECIFIGDSLKDIQAGNRAGMSTLVAGYGYIAEHDQPENWNACGTVNAPSELLYWIDDLH